MAYKVTVEAKKAEVDEQEEAALLALMTDIPPSLLFECYAMIATVEVVDDDVAQLQEDHPHCRSPHLHRQ
jgi:hypothetical protein